MPKIIGGQVQVVDTGALVIDEWAGNVATRNDTISIATVTIQSAPTSEPWLTIDYDEWLCVTKGHIELEYYLNNENEKKVLVVQAGETVLIAKGERFRPVFPVADTTYVAICHPAFAPDRCIREEEGTTSEVSQRLQELHHQQDSTNGPKSAEEATLLSTGDKSNDDEEEVLFHMCQKETWDAAVRRGGAYFPPTFVVDGRFTHATAIPSRLLVTANHFYQKSVGDWICLQLSRSALFQLGIDTVFEDAKPVGDTATHEEWSHDSSATTPKWICPHIYGGIPTHIPGVVTQTFPMTRNPDDGSFLHIVGLTD
jgi:uncharacterized protein (DUF952 family)